MARTNEDMDNLEKASPYLRTAMAFLIYLVKRPNGIPSSYDLAEEFIKKLKEDVSAS